ncbi:MAG: prephenate dehydrogenase [Propionibacteriaceae bacterium]|nr:prephenate dehydrogenase [Propionibacteriaceae bacterium]
MALRFTSLDEWRRWQSRQHLARRVRHALAPKPRAPAAWLWRDGEGEPELVVIIESGGSTPAQALGAVLPYLSAGFAVLAPAGYALGLPLRSEVAPDSLPRDLGGVRMVLSLGAHLPLAAAAAPQLPGARQVVVQHGLLTPLAPPLPQDATLLAWSSADAEFYTAGREDTCAHVLGSQLLWAAARHPTQTHTGRPLYLGQLHGAELPRPGLTRAAFSACRASGAVYRPHPAERDKLSRWIHQAMRGAGIPVAVGDTPLREAGVPVIGVFSTGVLEAAAAGLPAFVHYPRPPRWLGQFWERYGMRRWGDEPTPAPVTPEAEPARAIASWVSAQLNRDFLA